MTAALLELLGPPTVGIEAVFVWKIPRTPVPEAELVAARRARDAGRQAAWKQVNEVVSRDHQALFLATPAPGDIPSP